MGIGEETPPNAKIAEQSVKENEQKYRMLGRTGYGQHFYASFQGNFLVVNPASCKMFTNTDHERMVQDLS